MRLLRMLRGTMLANDTFRKTLGEQVSPERASQEGSQINKVWSAQEFEEDANDEPTHF